MAKFTTQLSEPKPNAGVEAPTPLGQSDLSAATQAAKTGFDVFQTVRAREEQKRQQQSLAGMQTDLINLEDERNALLLEDQQLATQVQQITQDGITPDEQAQLASLEKQRAKLTEARRSGVLNPLNYQTRLNALHKQALADVSNLAIQPQINALFNQGRSNVQAPVPTAQAQFAQQMDQMYGVGGWSGVDAGRERGKAIYLNQLRADAHNNFQTFVGQESMGYMTAADSLVREMNQALNTKGALQDVDLDRYRTGLSSLTINMLSQIDSAVQENRANGLPIDVEMVKLARQRVLDNQALFMNYLKEDQVFGPSVQLGQRLKGMNSVVDSLNKARMPGFASAASTVMGNGTNGDILAMAQLAGQDATLLEGVAANSDIPVTAQELKTQAANYVAIALDGIDFKDAAEQGLVNNRLAAIVAGTVLKVSDNEKTIDSFLSPFEGVPFNDTESSLDLLNTPKTQNNLKATPKGLKRMPAVAVHMLDNIKAEITPGEAEFLRVQPDGSLQIELPNDPAVRARVSRFSLYTNKLLTKYNDFINNYSKEIGISKEELYRDLLPQDEQEGEVSE